MNASEHTYAGLVSRGLAFGVDATIVAVFSIGLIGAVEVIGYAIGASSSRFAGSLTPVLAALPPVLFVAYSTVWWALTGRTIGMVLFGVRVIRTRNRPMTWTVAFVRALARALLLWGVVWCPFDRRRQALHDKVAGTLVIYDPPRGSASPARDEVDDRTAVPMLPTP